MDQHDRDAMRRAIEMLRADPDYREQLEQMLRTQPWEEAGLFAAAICRIKSLHLRPWQCAPCDCSDGAPSDRYGSRPAEIELRQRMKRAGVSVFHPDPLGALGAAEAKPAA